MVCIKYRFMKYESVPNTNFEATYKSWTIVKISSGLVSFLLPYFFHYLADEHIHVVTLNLLDNDEQ